MDNNEVTTEKKWSMKAFNYEARKVERDEVTIETQEGHTMPYTRLGPLALTIAFALGLLAASPGFAQVKPPKDMSFDQGKDSPGAATP